MSELSSVTFLDVANDRLFAYAKQSRGNSVITVVNVDPRPTPEGLAIVAARLGLPLSFTVHDVVFDECFRWRIGPNYFRVEPCVRRERVDRGEV